MIPIIDQFVDALVGLAIGPSGTQRLDSAHRNRQPSQGSPSGPEATAGAVPTAVRKDHADRDYDVFVSYRRDKGSEVARLLAEKLQARGYRVFLDVDGLGSGEWGKELSQRIEECPDFIAVITDSYFVRCGNPDDVVRHEIAHAIKTGATVVPLLVGEAGIPASLPQEIRGISTHNGVRYLHDYAEQAIDKVCGFLSSTPLLGPERLGTGEVQPRVVLFCVLAFIGVWRGAIVGEDLMFPWWLPAGMGLAMGIAAVILVVLPTMVGLTAYGNSKGIRRDLLYAGPWAPFWALIVPFMFFITSMTVALLQKAVWGRSFLLGGIIGGLVAIPVTRAIVSGNLYSIVAKSLGLPSPAVAGRTVGQGS